MAAQTSGRVAGTLALGGLIDAGDLPRVTGKSRQCRHHDRV
ncbi:MAG: hypothetical protein ACPHJ3_17630 [Rubripirellula sp.]